VIGMLLSPSIHPCRGPGPAWSGPGADHRTGRRGPSPAAARPGTAVRSWPLLVLAAPAAAEVRSAWVDIAQKTGFGLASPLQLNTAVTPGRRRGLRYLRTRCAPGRPEIR
jgi:hypothetical protein